jgi:hypothetical protein
MGVRLGNVLYWTGCILAIVALIFGAVVHVNDPSDTSQDCVMLFVVLGAVPAVILWLIGRACRYVLAGR